MLTIKCPNGQLDFPKDVLYSSPYIRNTLIYKQFFSEFKQSKVLFLNFLLNEIEFLVKFIRTGIISRANIEVLEYLNNEPQSALDFSINILKYNGMMLNGAKLMGDFDINLLNDENNPIYIYDMDIASKRIDYTRKITPDIIGKYMADLYNKYKSKFSIKEIKALITQIKVSLVNNKNLIDIYLEYYGPERVRMESLESFIINMYPDIDTPTKVTQSIIEEIRNTLLTFDLND